MGEASGPKLRKFVIVSNRQFILSSLVLFKYYKTLRYGQEFVSLFVRTENTPLILNHKRERDNSDTRRTFYLDLTYSFSPKCQFVKVVYFMSSSNNKTTPKKKRFVIKEDVNTRQSKTS